MKTEIKRLTTENFKGIKSFTVEFEPTKTHFIVGDNRTGKTSFFDSWTWLLFGCDSSNHVKLTYAPLDRPGDLPVVEAVVQINGEEVILLKTETRDAKGIKNEYSINGKALTAKQYQEQLAAKAGVWMNVWKTLTNPLGFFALDPEDRLDMLFLVESPALFDEISSFIKIKKEAKDLKKQILEHSVVQKELEDLVATCSLNGNRFCEEKEEEVQQAINLLTDMLLEKEEKMISSWNTIAPDLTSIQKRLNSFLEPLSVSLIKETANEVSIICDVFWNRIPLKNLSFSERVLAGLHLVNKLSEAMDFYPPVWIDNGESIMSLPKMKNQMIILAAMPGIPLTYRVGGSHAKTTGSKAKRTV